MTCTTAYVAGSSPAPLVAEVDVTDPAAPSLVRTLEVPGGDATPYALALLGDQIFVAAGEAGLQILAR